MAKLTKKRMNNIKKRNTQKSRHIKKRKTMRKTMQKTVRKRNNIKKRLKAHN
jgi:hypothetical protein